MKITERYINLEGKTKKKKKNTRKECLIQIISWLLQNSTKELEIS